MNRHSTKLFAALGVAVVSLVVLVSRDAAAQSDPKFDFGKPEAVKAVEWKSQVKGGLLATTGNSQTINGSVGASVSRKEGNNKLALDGNLAYGKSRIITATPDAAVANQTDLNEQSIETTNNWLAKGRYDRFFTLNNAGYALAQAGADKIAGKTFMGGGQVGYSRQLHKSDLQLLVAEIGYDFSYERYIQVPMKTLDPVSIHSARVFVGDTLKLSDATGITGSVEALFNLNKEGAAINVDTGKLGVDPFKDTRINGKVGLTTTLHKDLSIGVGFTLKYDENPAPRPIPAGVPATDTIVYGPGLGQFSQTVDTQTEITLIYTFL
ncbi:MAG TPA: DUF481 domain-containing protein [Polyangia bacterium]|jgi:hypothetical protein|nr:DUF481 domain-containing protein [Polyangia bacterium]